MVLFIMILVFIYQHCNKIEILHSFNGHEKLYSYVIKQDKTIVHYDDT